MSVCQEARGDYILIRVTGLLDGRTRDAQEFARFLEASAMHADGDFVIDLSKVDYINSSMLGELVRFLYAVQAADHRVVLMAPPPTVEGVLTMTGLGELMPIAGDESKVREILGVAKERQARPVEDVDYGQLADEIEEIILGNDAMQAAQKRQHGELRKVLGEPPARKTP